MKAEMEARRRQLDQFIEDLEGLLGTPEWFWVEGVLEPVLKVAKENAQPPLEVVEGDTV